MQGRFRSIDGQFRVTSDMLDTDRYREIFSLKSTEPLITRGSGLAYVDASFGESTKAICFSRFNRILDFNPKEKTIRVEAGMTVGQLCRFLCQHQLTLPVIPGHPAISIGGCIASNITSKSLAFPKFESVVRQLRIFHPDKGILTLSANENSDLFALTIGGMGLTGIILDADLSLDIPTSWRLMENVTPVASFSQAIERMKSERHTADFMYSWHMSTQIRRHFGRGFVVTGQYLNHDPRTLACDYRHFDADLKLSVLDMLVYSPSTTPLLQQFYYHIRKLRSGKKRLLYDFCFSFARRTNYFRLYGDSGFIEHQALIPESVAHDYFDKLQSLALSLGVVMPLLQIKWMDTAPKFLRFNGTGFVLTLNLPKTAVSFDFLEHLDVVNAEMGVVPNLLHDARMTEHHAKTHYPEYHDFRDALLEYDPHRLFRSGLSERLAL